MLFLFSKKKYIEQNVLNISISNIVYSTHPVWQPSDCLLCGSERVSLSESCFVLHSWITLK